MNINSVSGISNVGTANSFSGKAGALQADTSGSFAEKLEQAERSINKTQDAAKLKKVCQDMEAVFLNFMMSKMRETVPKDGLLKESNAQVIMTSMLDTELTKNMSQAGGIGLADLLYRQLSQDREANGESQTP
ncbi:hypothetical protein P22_1580 [Propionispora sp. 2/2-37]|nr:hypothetical protein P22_1580 [Propionispora sp. 2/2-37]